MNRMQQTKHGQAIRQVHARIDTLAGCVDEEVAQKMTEIRNLVTRLDGEARTYTDLQVQDVRMDTDRQIDALTKRIAAFENMTMRQAIRHFFARVW